MCSSQTIVIIFWKVHRTVFTTILVATLLKWGPSFVIAGEAYLSRRVRISTYLTYLTNWNQYHLKMISVSN